MQAMTTSNAIRTMQAIAVLFLAGFVTTGAAQTLPEIARAIRAQRSPAVATGPTFTNDNIRQVRATLASGNTESRAPLDTAATPESGDGTEQVGEAAADTAAGTLSEEEWRGRFDGLRSEITRAENRALLAEQELQTLNRRLLTESSLYDREGQLTPLIIEKQAELEQARQNVVAANEALEALRQELRRAGGPPGWSR